MEFMGPDPCAAAVSATGTRDRILDVAQRLIQLRGYCATSYADIADVMSIRKASIHYHFPSKADLGSAVVERYAKMFEGAMTDASGNRAYSRRDMVDAYFSPYLELADDPDLVCLCGVLAGELTALPRAMQTRLRRFFSFHQKWLTQVLTAGLTKGEFRLPSSPSKYARLIVDLLQGALLVKRATGDSNHVYDAITILRSQLAPTSRA
jgi:TetR/AcrR family transcriptional regulator, transcriptional repressor for nem operon